jgi:hypothetical protein
MNAIRKYTMQEFKDFIQNEVVTINDTSLLILKSHIIVEYTMNCYLEAISKSDDSDFFKENFSFSEKIKMVKYFGELGNKEENLIKELTLLNKLRNDIAHSLTYNQIHLNELFAELEKKNPKGFYSNKLKSDNEKIVGAVAFLCGAIFSGYKRIKNPDELDAFLEEARSKRN